MPQGHCRSRNPAAGNSKDSCPVAAGFALRPTIAYRYGRRGQRAPRSRKAACASLAQLDAERAALTAEIGRLEKNGPLVRMQAPGDTPVRQHSTRAAKIALFLLLAAARIRLILGARRGFLKRRQQATATPAPMSPGPLLDAAAVESRSCLARPREGPEKQASGVPENRENASITGKRRISIPINTCDCSAPERTCIRCAGRIRKPAEGATRQRVETGTPPSSTSRPWPYRSTPPRGGRPAF